MNTSVTVVNLIHDPKADTDTPKVLGVPGLQLAGKLDTSGTGTSKDPSAPSKSASRPAFAPWATCYVQWAALPLPKGKALDAQAGLGRWCRVRVQSLTAEEYARLEKTHPCCTVAAVSDNREPLLPHWHVEGR